MSNFMFQSPRSGKFVSNENIGEMEVKEFKRFNPLDRGNLYLIRINQIRTSSYLRMGVSIP